MKRLVTVQKVIDEADSPLTPTASKLLESIKKEAVHYTVIWDGENKYQVSGPWSDQCIVDMQEKVCSCRHWELTGIPCKHAVATIWDMQSNGMDVDIPEKWVHQCYWLSTWIEMYGFKIHPINGRQLWNDVDCPTKLTPPVHHT